MSIMKRAMRWSLGRKNCLLVLLATSSFVIVVESVGIDLGGGVVTQTNVEKYAALALDVKDMNEKISNGDVNDASNLYKEGANAASESDGSRLSLQDLSLDLAKLSFLDACPSFIYHLYGLSDRSTDLFTLESHAKYGDTEVRSLLTRKPALATTAAVIMNMWMYSTYLLHQGLDHCYKRSIADNADVVPLDGGGMDEFIALWIGKGRIPGTADGNGLYGWTQQMGNYFGKNNPEAAVNTDLKLLYQEGVTALSFPNGCTPDNANSMPHLWGIAQRMISKATVPLMQGLIYSIMNKDVDLSKLYARALFPQISQCRPSIYKRLRLHLLDASAIDFRRTEDIIANLQQVYGCLGFTCNDIGTYMGVTCQEQDRWPLAEYNPSMDVRDASKIDLDILQVKILTSLQSYQSAKYLYIYGRNSPVHRNTENDPYLLNSLQQMAKTEIRQNMDQVYKENAEYFRDINYSDKVVLQTLDGEGKYGSKSAEYRYEVVAKTIQYQIMHVFALAQMGVVRNKCRDSNIDGLDGARHGWDHVAALLIGSLEGTEEGGSLDLEDGQLAWNLANKRAHQFNTMNTQKYAQVNSELEQLLFSGSGAIHARNCEFFNMVDDDVHKLLMVPLIQSTLKYAILNEGTWSENDDPHIAAGETLALSVLPHAASYGNYRFNYAADIADVLVTRPGTNFIMVKYGPQAVANSLYTSVLKDSPYGCDYVGATPTHSVDACALAGGLTKVKESEEGSSSTVMTVVFIVMAMVCLVLLFWIMYGSPGCTGLCGDSPKSKSQKKLDDEHAGGAKPEETVSIMNGSDQAVPGSILERTREEEEPAVANKNEKEIPNPQGEMA